MKTEVCAIFAIGPDNVIGIEDKMPWHSKSDFYHYKQVTKGYPCIFGERTFFGLPKYPLADRLNVVTSFSYKEPKFVNTTETKDGKLINTGSYLQVPSIEEAIRLTSNYSKIFICGGRSIYKYCLDNNLIDTIYLTEIISEELEDQINTNPNKYVRFPLDIKKYTKNWESEEIFYDPRILPKEENDIITKFLKLSRQKTR